MHVHNYTSVPVMWTYTSVTFPVRPRATQTRLARLFIFLFFYVSLTADLKKKKMSMVGDMARKVHIQLVVRRACISK